MDDNPEEDLKEKAKLSQKSVSRLLKENESLLQKKMKADPTVDPDLSVKQSLIVDDNKQLMDIDLDMESIQQQLKLALEKNLTTQSALSASVDRPMIQSDANQLEVAKVTINQQFKRSDENKGQNEVSKV